MADNIDDMYKRARAAFEEIEYCSQERADEMATAAAWLWSRESTAKVLAKLAVDESRGIGVYEDKLHKIQNKTRGTMRDMVGQKSAGLIREDKELGLKIFAKPMGVIANVVPCTNPESTVCCIGSNILKTRNAMIVSPHPRTKKTSYETVEYGRAALKKIGAPEDLMQCIEEPSHDKTRELMEKCDFAVATGGAALVKVVYEAATPCHTVGAGNVISIVDETVDLKETAAKIIKSKTANNAASCSSENAIALEASIYDKMLECFVDQGGYMCSTEEREKLRAYMWPDGKHLNRDIVAKPAMWIAEQAGLKVPEGTRFMMVIGEQAGPEDRFSGEKISLVLTVWKWTDFSEMIERMKEMHRFSGEGHSASIHSTNVERQEELATKANVGRVNCNMPHAAANSGSWFNGNPTTDTIGCGTWAGNMTTDNINWRNFLNYTWLSTPIKENIPTDEYLFGDYLKKWEKD